MCDKNKVEMCTFLFIFYLLFIRAQGTTPNTITGKTDKHKATQF